MAIIPARGGSKRLRRKNIHPIWGRPMIEWAIRACRESRHVSEVYVSTEDAEIAQSALGAGAKVVERPAALADDVTFKQTVIVDAATRLGFEPDLIISLQANSPQVCAHDLDAAVEMLYRFDRNEIFSVNEDLVQNGAFRVMRFEYVFQRSLSTYCGVLVTGYTDVHTLADVEYLESHSRPCAHHAEETGNGEQAG